MKAIIESIQTKLITIPGLKYVDENWGQLDDYSPNFPVQWPCALIDVSDATFSNIGMDRSQEPANRQMATIIVELRVANLKLTNTSARSPQAQKDLARSIWDLIDETHKQLQGFSPVANCGKLVRTRRQRVRRDDGIQEYIIMYSGSVNDV